jgi:hypothetical protein
MLSADFDLFLQSSVWFFIYYFLSFVTILVNWWKVLIGTFHLNLFHKLSKFIDNKKGIIVISYYFWYLIPPNCMVLLVLTFRYIMILLLFSPFNFAGRTSLFFFLKHNKSSLTLFFLRPQHNKTTRPYSEAKSVSFTLFLVTHVVCIADLVQEHSGYRFRKRREV